jgi:hypothetical protein
MSEKSLPRVYQRPKNFVKQKSIVLSFLFLIFSLAVSTTYAGKIETAESLAVLLLSARSVTVNKNTISNPSKFNVKKFIKKTKRKYQRIRGKKFDKSNRLLVDLMESIEQVIRNAKKGNYKDWWPSADYANIFLPARFARETAILFGERSQGKAMIKLTTTNDFLINIDNQADEFEKIAIENNFLSSDWKRNQSISKETDEGFRFLFPEYYSAGCLKCHGGETGQRLHPSHRSGKLGDFGGAIRVILK